MLSLAEFPEYAIAINADPRELFDEILTEAEAERAAARSRKRKSKD